MDLVWPEPNVLLEVASDLPIWKHDTDDSVFKGTARFSTEACSSEAVIHQDPGHDNTSIIRQGGRFAFHAGFPYDARTNAQAQSLILSRVVAVMFCLPPACLSMLKFIASACVRSYIQAHRLQFLREPSRLENSIMPVAFQASVRRNRYTKEAYSSIFGTICIPDHNFLATLVRPPEGLQSSLQSSQSTGVHGRFFSFFRRGQL